MPEFIKIGGGREIDDAFKMLSNRAGVRVLKSSAHAGASALRKGLIHGAPYSAVNRKTVRVRYGKMHGVKGRTYQTIHMHLRQQIKTTVVKAIEVEVKELIHSGDAFWGWFVEKGTKVRKGRGSIKAQHWAENAFAATEEQALEAMEKKLDQAIFREAAK